MSKFFQEFKTFAMRGNMIDMAVGIIVGGAFGKIVSSFVSDVLMPPLGLLLGGMDFTSLKLPLKKAVTDPSTGQVVQDAVSLNYGNFIQNTVDFLIVAFAIFLFIRLLNRLHAKKEEQPAPEQKPEDVQILTEIRDMLKKELPENDGKA